MPFTIPNDYVQGSDINASDVRDNFRSARRYTHTIEANDIDNDAVRTENITKPDQIFGGDFKLTSGSILYANNSFKDDQSEFITSHIKQQGFTSRDLYVDMAGCGKSFTLERTADCLVTCFCFVYALKNTELSDAGNANEVYLYVDNSREQETLAYIADYDGDTTTGTPGHAGHNKARWSPLTFMWSGQLSAGTHTIKIKCNPKLEFMLFRNVSLLIRCAY